MPKLARRAIGDWSKCASIAACRRLARIAPAAPRAAGKWTPGGWTRELRFFHIRCCAPPTAPCGKRALMSISPQTWSIARIATYSTSRSSSHSTPISSLRLRSRVILVSSLKSQLGVPIGDGQIVAWSATEASGATGSIATTTVASATAIRTSNRNSPKAKTASGRPCAARRGSRDAPPKSAPPRADAPSSPAAAQPHAPSPPYPQYPAAP